jgi:hypothetical protein
VSGVRGGHGVSGVSGVSGVTSQRRVGVGRGVRSQRDMSVVGSSRGRMVA